jgi:hypothetical protein
MPVAVNQGTAMIIKMYVIRPPIWRGTRTSHSITRVQAYSLRSLKKAECGPLGTGPGGGRELKRGGTVTLASAGLVVSVPIRSRVTVALSPTR